MKQLNKAIFLSAAVIAITTGLSSFTPVKKETKPVASYTITFIGKEQIGNNYQWTWSVLNPLPGNGSNGTLQNISHWSLPLCPLAEAAIVSAEYSYDQVNWTSVSIDMERDPSIRVCTTTDVLKFNTGTSGTAPLYCRITFNKDFILNPFAVSYIKTGGGLQGCNVYLYSGIGCETPPTAPRND
jgi:hypothetical protein